MLTFRQLDDLPDSIVDIITQAEQDIISDMARRIAKGGSITDTAQWQLYRLEAMGAERDYVSLKLHKALDMSEHQLIKLFDEAATRALASDDKIYRAAGYNPLPLSENAYMQQIIQAGLKKTLNTYWNLTKTTADTASRQFENVLDRMYHQIVFGGFTYQQAIKAGIRDLSRDGIGVIRYTHTGWVDFLDVAFRRATLTGVNQTCAELQLRRMDEMGTDLVETTAHFGARTAPVRGPMNHAWWQGRWFSRSPHTSKYPDFYKETGYGTGDGLCGWNCRHSFFPVIEGLSDRAYDIETLRLYNSKMVTYNGKDMSLYDATQQQRYIERQIRHWKREASAMEAAGLDSSYANEKIREWQARQRDFIGQTGLRRDYFRERAGKQNLDSNPKRGIITLDKEGRQSFAKMDYAALSKNNIQASNLAVREWYLDHISSISGQIDLSQSLQDQARQAFGLRNQYRTEARMLMSDKGAKAFLEQEKPNRGFEELLTDKMKRKGLTRDEALQDIIKTAIKSNSDVNKELGLDK